MTTGDVWLLENLENLLYAKDKISDFIAIGREGVLSA
jgi:hypothetical protein